MYLAYLCMLEVLVFTRKADHYRKQPVRGTYVKRVRQLIETDWLLKALFWSGTFLCWLFFVPFVPFVLSLVLFVPFVLVTRSSVIFLSYLHISSSPRCHTQSTENMGQHKRPDSLSKESILGPSNAPWDLHTIVGIVTIRRRRCFMVSSLKCQFSRFRQITGHVP